MIGTLKIRNHRHARVSRDAGGPNRPFRTVPVDEQHLNITQHGFGWEFLVCAAKSTHLREDGASALGLIHDYSHVARTSVVTIDDFGNVNTVPTKISLDFAREFIPPQPTRERCAGTELGGGNECCRG
jgi:hypothetical protein